MEYCKAIFGGSSISRASFVFATIGQSIFWIGGMMLWIQTNLLDSLQITTQLHVLCITLLPCVLAWKIGLKDLQMQCHAAGVVDVWCDREAVSNGVREKVGYGDASAFLWTRQAKGPSTADRKTIEYIWSIALEQNVYGRIIHYAIWYSPAYSG